MTPEELRADVEKAREAFAFLKSIPLPKNLKDEAKDKAEELFKSNAELAMTHYKPAQRQSDKTKLISLDKAILVLMHAEEAFVAESVASPEEVRAQAVTSTIFGKVALEEEVRQLVQTVWKLYDVVPWDELIRGETFKALWELISEPLAIATFKQVVSSIKQHRTTLDEMEAIMRGAAMPQRSQTRHRRWKETR